MRIVIIVPDIRYSFGNIVYFTLSVSSILLGNNTRSGTCRMNRMLVVADIE